MPIEQCQVLDNARHACRGNDEVQARGGLLDFGTAPRKCETIEFHDRQNVMRPCGSGTGVDCDIREEVPGQTLPIHHNDMHHALQKVARLQCEIAGFCQMASPTQDSWSAWTSTWKRPGALRLPCRRGALLVGNEAVFDEAYPSDAKRRPVQQRNLMAQHSRLTPCFAQCSMKWVT